MAVVVSKGHIELSMKNLGNYFLSAEDSTEEVHSQSIPSLSNLQKMQKIVWGYTINHNSSCECKKVVTDILGKIDFFVDLQNSS